MAEAGKRVALITGVSEGGLGYHLSREFLRHGWTVVGTVRRRGAEGDLVAQGAEIISMEVGSDDSVRIAAADFHKLHDRLDLLICNAGIGAAKGFVIDSDIDNWQRVLDINVIGVVRTCRYFGPIMAKQGFGTICNTASVVGIAPCPFHAACESSAADFFRLALIQLADNVSKAAVRSLSESLAYEMKPLGVNVVTLSPGLVATDFSKNVAQNTGDKGSWDHVAATPTASLLEQKGLQATIAALWKQGTTDSSGAYPVDRFAREAVHALSARSPPREVVIGHYSFVFTLLHTLLPKGLWDGLLWGPTFKLAGLKRAS